MPKKQRSISHYFILIALPAIFISFILLATVFYTRITSTKENLITNRMRKLELMHNEIEFTLKNIISDLTILSETDSFKNLIVSNNLESLDAVEDIFKLFSAERKVYDQVSLLDKTGMEIIRINYNNGSPIIVPSENLQNKGNRYYFQDTFVLDRGKDFFSPLDLNIERGVVEVPEKPMVRVGLPVFDKNGEKKGIILLNYFGQNITDIVSAYTKSSEDSFFLLNSDSYWLYSRDPEKSWSFMYKDRNEHMKTSSGSSSAKGKSSSLDSDDYFWKIVAELPDTVFYTLAKSIAAQMIILIISVFAIAFILSVILAKLWYIQKLSEQQARKSLEEKELLLREIHHWVKNSLTLEIEDIFMTAKPTISIGLIISELFINSVKYAFPDNESGKITVKISKEESEYHYRF